MDRSGKLTNCPAVSDLCDFPAGQFGSQKAVAGVARPMNIYEEECS
jgi:hypothetical protein